MSNFTNSTLFDLLVAIGGIIIGAVGLYVTLRVRARRSIKIYLEQATTLTESFQSAVPELAVTLGSDHINGRVVMLKLALANQGNADVAKQMVYTPLQLALPQHWRWLKWTVDDIRSTCPTTLRRLSSSQIEVTFDLLRARDVIFLQLVAEAPGTESVDDEDIMAALDVTCRILDIGKIEKVIVRTPNLSLARSFSVTALVVLWLLTTVVSTTRYVKEDGVSLRYRFVEVVDGVQTGRRAEVLSGPEHSVSLVDANTSVNRGLSGFWTRGPEIGRFSTDRELFASVTWHPTIERERIPILETAALSVLSLLLIVVIAWPWIMHLQRRRILRPLKR